MIAINEKLQDSSSIEYDMDRAATALSLADLTRKGIELLDNPKGIFMMVRRRQDRLGLATPTTPPLRFVIRWRWMPPSPRPTNSIMRTPRKPSSSSPAIMKRAA